MTIKLSWKAKCDTNLLLSEIKSNLISQKNGSVAIKPEADFIIDALLEQINHNVALDEVTLFNEFKNTIASAYVENFLDDQEKILKSFKSRCENTLKNNKKYTIVTSINVDTSIDMKSRTIDGARLTFPNKLPSKYLDARIKIISARADLSLREQKRFRFVVIHTAAPNEYTAFNKAIFALDIIRSIIQLSFVQSISIYEIHKTNKDMLRGSRNISGC